MMQKFLISLGMEVESIRKSVGSNKVVPLDLKFFLASFAEVDEG